MLLTIILICFLFLWKSLDNPDRKFFVIIIFKHTVYIANNALPCSMDTFSLNYDAPVLRASRHRGEAKHKIRIKVFQHISY